MANFVHLCNIGLVVLAVLMVSGAPTYAQISTPCNASGLSTLFTPCMGFLTNSSANGTSPTTGCCSALKSLTSGGMDCLCLIVTGSVPFQIPFNRSLAISLPRACNMPGVPVQCKASGSPLPAPGPRSLGPSPSPALGFAPTPTPQGSSVIPTATSPSMAPQSDTSPPLLSPPSPSVDSGTGVGTTPSASTGSGRSNVTPSSSAMTSYRVPSPILLIALGFSLLKYY